MKTVMMIAIALFAILAIWLGIYTNIAHQNDIAQHVAVDHAVSLAENRLQQAHEFFMENRAHFDTLIRSDILKEKQIVFRPYLIISMTDLEVWWPHEWSEIPWMTDDILESTVALLNPDTPGARENSIIFHGDSMEYTLFATPLHAVLYEVRPLAWVLINHGETYPRSDRRVISEEAAQYGFYVTVTSEILRNESRLYLFLTILFTVLTIASIIILIWGIKTYRFISDPDTTTKTITIMIIIIIVIVLFATFMINLLDIRFNI